MPDDAYDPATVLRVLSGMEPPRRRPAGHGEDVPARYPVEHGPGAGARVELVVRVLVGTECSTVIVADARDGRAVARQVLPHGGEPAAAAAAVEAAIADALQEHPR